jgi:hypothetical protein
MLEDHDTLEHDLMVPGSLNSSEDFIVEELGEIAEATEQYRVLQNEASGPLSKNK